MRRQGDFCKFILCMSIIIGEVQDIFVIQKTNIETCLECVRFFPSHGGIRQIVYHQRNFAIIVGYYFTIFIFHNTIRTLNRIIIKSCHYITISIQYTRHISIGSVTSTNFSIRKYIATRLHKILSTQYPTG